MKIQELAIIFIIIILPISLLLSEYTQFQISTIGMQTEYDTKLTTASYDAIKAYQLNSINESYSDLANENIRGLEASISTFRNSIMTAFELNGYTKDELNNYIPALVYTLYDGFYIYSPYENTNYRYETDDEGNILENKPIDENGEQIYGLKPYIKYSCRYQTTNIDVVITYALDNYVTVQGKIGEEYVNKGGYLIDNIEVSVNSIKYNGIEIKSEHLREEVLGKKCSYVKVNGVKYYFIEDYNDGKTTRDIIAYISNGTLLIDTQKTENISVYKALMTNNDSAMQYYQQANEFTEWFKSTGLVELKYSDAVDTMINEEGNIESTNIWSGNETKIFDFNDGENPIDNIENEKSDFNQHRLAIIRHKIETNLAIALSNYNEYSGAATSNVFQMPELKEDEWDHITHNICLISFLQGLPIGGKIYNGYSLVTNSESKEVVLEDNIYILGKNITNDTYSYHKINDNGFKSGGNIAISVEEDYADSYYSAGRLNLDFKRAVLAKQNEGTYYYYPLKKYNASYDSIVMQNNVTTYDDIYEYINNCGNDGLKQAFYTALGRERISKYNSNNEIKNMNAPYIPDGYTVVKNTDINTGFVIQDSSGNEYVWVEVPKTTEVYTTAGISITEFGENEFKKIENDLRAYSTTYGKSSVGDEWHEATGLTKNEYDTQKQKMLKSIYLYGGFYIGRYETGIDYSEGARTAGGDTMQAPVIKQNAYPYNWVTVRQAQDLSESFSIVGYSTSLLFGVQWDLTMKYLEAKGAATEAELKKNSTTWGNYLNNEYQITNENAKYLNNSAEIWKNVTSTFYKGNGSSVALTTGASEKFSKQNIYDLGGNLYEWVLAKGSNSSAVERGNYWGDSDIKYAASCHGTVNGNQPTKFRTFRVSLYKDVGPYATSEIDPPTYIQPPTTDNTDNTEQPPYVPSDFTQVDGTNFDNGIVVEDFSGNQFVWVEVPRTTTVYPTAGLDIKNFTSEEFKKIEKDLHTYTSVYRNGTTYTDTYSSEAATGLTEAEYNTLKKKMLKSIYINGGFYVGRYETGVNYGENPRTGLGSTMQTPVIKPNTYPYNFVTSAQAQDLSERFKISGYEASLMFGVQWDLIMKYLENKGTAPGEILTDSSSWGNYVHSAYNITNTNAKYAKYSSSSSQWVWNDGPLGEKKSDTKVLLSTGSDDRWSKQNIYDLAGNEYEFTLENTQMTENPISTRGGHFYQRHIAARRGLAESNYGSVYGSFRVVLYKDEGTYVADEENKPSYIPDGYKAIDGSMDDGFVIADELGNEYVWVEVPRTTTVYPTAGLNIKSFSSEEFYRIENDLNKYASSYDETLTNYIHSDEWSSEEILGVTENEYNILKKKMLKSIYINGGFYIGRYETGIQDKYRSSIGETLQTPVIKKDAYTYNFVSAAEAQELASRFKTTGYESSLMFGVQWNLTLKYLENKGTSPEQLNGNSTSWGNFGDSTYRITNANAKYNIYNPTSKVFSGWKTVPYEKLSVGATMLTTGASEQFCKQNIYDLAGNTSEITLEKRVRLSDGYISTVSRSGTFASSYNASDIDRISAAQEWGYTTTYADPADTGFRVALYKDEGVSLIRDYDASNLDGNGLTGVETNKIKDLAGNYDGTIYGNPTFGNGYIALNQGIPGTIQYIDIGPIRDVSALTINLKFSVSEIGTQMYLIGNQDTAGVELYITPTGKLRWAIYREQGSKYEPITSPTTIEPNVIYDVKLVYDGKKSYMYINGTLVGELDTLGGNIKNPGEIVHMFIGANPSSNPNDSDRVDYNENVAKMKFYKAKVQAIKTTGETLEREYDASNLNGKGATGATTKIKDFTGNYDGTIYGNPTFGNGYISLNQGNLSNVQYIDMGPMLNLSQVTVNCKFSVSETEISGGQDILGNTQSGGFCLSINSSGQIGFGVRTENGTSYEYAHSTTKAEANTIYDVTGTYDGKNVYLYVNGVLEGTLETTGGKIKNPENGEHTLIGADPIGTGANTTNYIARMKLYKAKVYTLP